MTERPHLLGRCGWSVWNRYTPQKACGRRTVDGEHCKQHARMAARIDAKNADALAELRATLGGHD